MTTNRPQATTTTRQKITLIVFALVLLFLLYQIYGLFRTPVPSTPPTAQKPSEPGVAMAPVRSPQPQPAHLLKPEILSAREIELMKLQQETQAKYLSALNELQMLKISREIAETNQAIMSAKLQTITAQKQMVDLLSPPAPTVSQPSISQVLEGPAGVPIPTEQPVTQPAAPPPAVLPSQQEVSYRVVSVMQIRGRWSAVIAYQSNLYSVMVGDILPPDRAKVISINKSGVILQQNGSTRRISLVPII